MAIVSIRSSRRLYENVDHKCGVKASCESVLTGADNLKKFHHVRNKQQPSCRRQYTHRMSTPS